MAQRGTGGGEARRALVVAAAALIGACTGAPPAQGDGGGADAGPVAPMEVAPPVPPELPAWSCPSGWSPVSSEGATGCAPWAERPRCAAGELLAPGGGCEPLADDCGSDAPPELTDAMALVVPGAIDGDGSRARPFGSIAQAVAAGHSEIALAPGEHAMLGAFRGLTVVGTCPTNTTIVLGAISSASDATFRRLRITGEQLSLGRGHSLVLDRVELGGVQRALQIEGTLRARRVAFRDVTEAAIIAFAPDEIELEDVSMERTPAGLWVDEGDLAREPPARVVLRRVAAAEIDGTALQAQGGVSFELSEVAVDSTDAGILADVQALSLRDVFVRDAARVAVGAVGPGTRELARVHVEASGTGVLLGGGQTAAQDFFVRGCGLALTAQDGERGRLERIFATEASTYAIEITGGSIELADLRVAGVTATRDDDGGALAISTGAHVTLARAQLTGSTHFGIGVSRQASLDASDVSIEHVQSNVGEDGHGIIVFDGASLGLTRARIEDVGEVAVFVEDSSATLEDLAIASVRAPTGAYGVGVHVRAGRDGATAPASVVLARAAIRDTRHSGIHVYGAGASLRATDVVIAASMAADDGGIGLAVEHGAEASVERFVLRGCALAGALLGGETVAELSRGRIEGNPFGLLADPSLAFNTGGSPGFSVRGVVFVDNEVDHQPTRRELAPPGPVSF